MFGDRHHERVRQMFADQFESEGEDYVYRRNMREAAVRVSSAERDKFVATFNRDCRRLIWGAVAATVALIMVLVLVVDDSDPRHDLYLYGLTGAILAGFLIAWRLVWNAPARAVARRPVLGGRRTRAEVRRLMLTRMTWGQLAATAAATVLGWLHFKNKMDVWTGWGRLWLGVGGVLAILLAWQAVMKWRLDRAEPRRN